jgi:beta-hydroxylase
MIQQFQVYIDKDLFTKIDPSLLSNFYNIKDFPYLKEIEDNFTTIYKELERVTSTHKNMYQIWPQQHLIEIVDSWSTIVLVAPKNNNHKNTENIKVYTEEFPETINILKKALGSRFDSAAFSKISANSKILPHQGRFSNTLRCHLGIKIPEGDCKIKVRNESAKWEQGKILILDDRLTHEVWNLTDQERIVLIFDFVPDHIPNFFSNYKEN